MEKKVQKITLNDYDRSIYAFWYAVLNHTKEFCERIERVKVNMENWHRAKEVQKNKEKADVLELGFSTFFLNRTNISGIINAGVIGGTQQQGKYKIDCRFNKKALIQKIKRIAERKEDIDLFHLDALLLIKKIQRESNNKQTIFYFDPPYYAKGASLYMSYYTEAQHREISKAITGIENIHWIISYDNTPEIKRMYAWVPHRCTREYVMHHFAYKKREGRELLLFSNDLLVPKWDKNNISVLR